MAMNRRAFLCGATVALGIGARDRIAIPKSAVQIENERERAIARIFVSVDDSEDRIRYAGKIHVYLDGVDVARRASYAWMPEQPGIEALGAVGLRPEALTIDNHQPVSTAGRVRWEWKAGEHG